MRSIGVDCGTQSLKVLLWDSRLGVIATASRAYDLIAGLPPGHKEQHPGEWLAALDSAMEELAAREDLSAVAAIGVSGQQHGLVVLDATDHVIRPAKLWCDTSTLEQCQRIMERAGGRAAYMKEIGNDLPPGFTASKILWLRETEPESYQRVASILLPHDYINFYLTGEKVAEPGDASGTGYFDVEQRKWSRQALQWIDSSRDIGDLLPRLIEPAQPAGELRAALAGRWNLPAGVVVSSGGGDNMMGAIGSGNVAPGVLTVSLGTSGTLFSYSTTPVLDPEGEIAAFCDSTGGWLPLGCTLNVTTTTEMIRDGFEMGDVAEFDRQVDDIPAGTDGLLLLPYLEGERLPNIPEGTGVLLGLRPQTATPAHLARAAMEGVTLGLRYGLDRMTRLGVDSREVRLIGGGASSSVWRQITADIFGLPVVSPASKEGPALGAALQAYWCASGEPIEEIASRFSGVDESTRCQPGESAELYTQLYEIHCRLSTSLRSSGLFPVHRRMIERKDPRL